jgi:hypothetical protein
MAAATFALAASAEDASAYGIASSVATSEGQVTRSLAFAPRKAIMRCSVEEESPTVSFDSLRVTARIEQRKHGEWKISNRFRQATATTNVEGGQHRIKTGLSVRYNLPALTAQSRKHPTRITCIGGDSSFLGDFKYPDKANLAVDFGKPPKHGIK